ncbi:23S rRNA (guanosine(2251)-2'-O)-methyltransferase RlmB [Methylophaga sp. OBS1]|uniref:23S rRNA (guanosine(2251)-2'-O)-methyltransferase RlmB n=1 Tax=Methylophaga sp. OBS1 TaxID=2991933 RepID=UPI0022562DC1|nr:23S rRNA (guanosine(2251)-2'-O)-methyltransferase RlmB [Methylophaga sp. OBS1]MCX4193477.1 23S rRNA (guanosine(2251)-2'-O)-methyltransferase RlmB [Methylophaga sp. OBS1]
MDPDIIYGLHAVQAALDVPVSRIKEVWLAADRQDQRVEALLTAAREQGIVVHKAERETLDKIAPEVQHQGCAARCKPLESLDEKGLLDLIENLSEPAFLLILDGVQDPHNLGACLRTAEAAGVHAVVAPKDRASGLTATAVKISSGAAERVPFAQVTNLSRLMKDLQQLGVWLVGTSGDAQQSLFQIDLKGPVAIVLGAEGKGIRRLTRDNCDEVIYIPMQGEAESLNVSVAAGVCLFEAYRQRHL